MATLALPVAEQRVFVASQWQLMWWRFRKHRLAVASGLVVIGFYLVVLGADFLAYSDPLASEAQRLGKPLDRAAGELLAARAGANLSALSGHLEKLAAHAGARPSISAEDVRALLSGNKLDSLSASAIM